VPQTRPILFFKSSQICCCVFFSGEELERASEFLNKTRSKARIRNYALSSTLEAAQSDVGKVEATGAAPPPSVSILQPCSDHRVSPDGLGWLSIAAWDRVCDAESASLFGRSEDDEPLLSAEWRRGEGSGSRALGRKLQHLKSRRTKLRLLRFHSPPQTKEDHCYYYYNDDDGPLRGQSRSSWHDKQQQQRQKPAPKSGTQANSDTRTAVDASTAVEAPMFEQQVRFKGQPLASKDPAAEPAASRCEGDEDRSGARPAGVDAWSLYLQRRCKAVQQRVPPALPTSASSADTNVAARLRALSQQVLIMQKEIAEFLQHGDRAQLAARAVPAGQGRLSAAAAALEKAGRPVALLQHLGAIEQGIKAAWPGPQRERLTPAAKGRHPVPSVAKELRIDVRE
jgi:hypothetical protein